MDFTQLADLRKSSSHGGEPIEDRGRVNGFVSVDGRARRVEVVASEHRDHGTKALRPQRWNARGRRDFIREQSRLGNEELTEFTAGFRN